MGLAIGDDPTFEFVERFAQAEVPCFWKGAEVADLLVNDHQEHQPQEQGWPKPAPATSAYGALGDCFHFASLL